MKKVAIIGGGISGLSAARILSKLNYDVTVFEKESTPGGLIRCTQTDGALYHRVGGHVFNTKVAEVEKWFWGIFDSENEFYKAIRNAKIQLGYLQTGYPIENHLHQMDSEMGGKIIDELLNLPQAKPFDQYPHFEAFLKATFGPTLYNTYFGPYNQKIWKTDLSSVSMDWLEGKLPMPKLNEVFKANIFKKPETEMVHSRFHYAKENGSQFIINKIAEGITIETNTPIESITRKTDGYLINNKYAAEVVIYTADIRRLPNILSPLPKPDLARVSSLKSNGTTNLLCLCDPTDVSWLYLPSPDTLAHRIIYTGNFSPANNPPGVRISCTVEFSGKYTRDECEAELSKLPGNLQAIDYHHQPSSYVLQDPNTRPLVQHVRQTLQEQDFYLLGRFAEWEYYNMDKCMEAAMRITNQITQKQQA